MKVYIIQPMRDRTEEQIKAEMERGKQVVRIYFPNAEFLETYFEDYTDEVNPLLYLSRSCALMAQADLVVMLPFYFGMPGCDLENHIAEIYRVPRMMINFHIEEDGSYPDIHFLDGGEE